MKKSFCLSFGYVNKVGRYRLLNFPMKDALFAMMPLVAEWSEAHLNSREFSQCNASTDSVSILWFILFKTFDYLGR